MYISSFSSKMLNFRILVYPVSNLSLFQSPNASRHTPERRTESRDWETTSKRITDSQKVNELKSREIGRLRRGIHSGSYARVPHVTTMKVTKLPSVKFLGSSQNSQSVWHQDEHQLAPINWQSQKMAWKMQLAKHSTSTFCVSLEHLCQ